MSNLYVLAEEYGQFLEIMDSLDLEDEDWEETMQAAFDTLEGIEGELDAKIESVACAIKNMQADADAIKAEEDTLKARRKALESKVDHIESYLMETLDKVGKVKVHGIRADVSVKKTPPAVRITDIGELLFEGGEYVKPRQLKETDLDKTRIKADIKDGKQVAGAELVSGRTLSIK